MRVINPEQCFEASCLLAHAFDRGAPRPEEGQLHQIFKRADIYPLALNGMILEQLCGLCMEYDFSKETVLGVHLVITQALIRITEGSQSVDLEQLFETCQSLIKGSGWDAQTEQLPAWLM